MVRFVQHHKKYKEIHGVDEVVLMEYGEHIKLHRRLRKEGKCNIPRDELNSISHKANARLESSKQYCKEYHRTHKELYRLCDKKRAVQKNEYRRNNIPSFEFNTTIGTNVQLYESIVYNINTTHIHIHSRFHSTKGKLKIIEEK